VYQNTFVFKTDILVERRNVSSAFKLHLPFYVSSSCISHQLASYWSQLAADNRKTAEMARCAETDDDTAAADERDEMDEMGDQADEKNAQESPVTKVRVGIPIQVELS
jgi:hypothetical protein